MQFVLNGLASGSVFALVAISFALIYRVNPFFNLTHGILFTFGAYLAYLLVVGANVHIAFACIAAFVVVGFTGCCLDYLVFRRLRQRGASHVILLLASIGIYVVAQNSLSIAFGDDVRSLQSGQFREGHSIATARATSGQLAMMATGLVVAIGVTLFLRMSKYGRRYRAVAENQGLANARGVNSEQVILLAFGIGSGLAGLGGVLLASDLNFSPNVGLHTLMVGVVAMILGGTNTSVGCYLGGLVIGLLQQLSVVVLGGGWHDTITFAVLVVVLLVRPQGLIR